MSNVAICQIAETLKADLKKFRYRKEKTVAAIVMKIDSENLLVVEDERYDDIEDIEEFVQELPEHLPRFIAFSYVLNHGDGRISYPLCFIFVSPSGTKPELQMMYAGSKLEVVQELGMTKVFELRSTEEFTEDWLKSKLALFK